MGISQEYVDSQHSFLFVSSFLEVVKADQSCDLNVHYVAAYVKNNPYKAADSYEEEPH